MSLEAMQRFGHHSKVDAEKFPEAAKVEGIVHRIVRDVGTEFEQTDADPKLTDMGKREQKQKIAERHLKELEGVASQGPMKSLRQSIAERENKLRLTINPDDDSPAQALREREVRDLLRDMDDSERNKAFRRALEQGDELTVHAVLRNPSVMPLLHDDVVNEGKRMWVEQKNPEVASALRDEQNTLATLTDMIDTARNGLRAEAGQEPGMRQRLEQEAANGDE